jgi:hypothetical protein
LEGRGELGKNGRGTERNRVENMKGRDFGGSIPLIWGNLKNILEGYFRGFR